jgi:hypothetical protein
MECYRYKNSALAFLTQGGLSVTPLLKNDTAKQESDLLVRESEVGTNSHFSGCFFTIF